MKGILVILLCLMALPIALHADINKVENLDQTKVYKGKIILKNGEILKSNNIAFDNGNIKLNSNVARIYLKDEIEFMRIKKGNYGFEGFLLGAVFGTGFVFYNYNDNMRLGRIVVVSAAVFGGIGLVAGLCTTKEKTYTFNSNNLSFSIANKSFDPAQRINNISLNYSISF